MLQNLKRLDELAATVADYEARGFTEITSVEKCIKYEEIVHFGWCMGGTGRASWKGHRLCTLNGHLVLMAPRARTHGLYLIGDRVLVSPA